MLGPAASLLSLACAAAPAVAPPQAAGSPILVASERVSHWPVEGESRPGIFVRLEAYQAPVGARELLNDLQLLVEHGSRRQLLGGAAFDSLDGAGDSHQSRYLYTPLQGTLFVTLKLRARGRELFPDTQRIELNDDCWHMLSYRVTAMPVPGLQHPPPHPRTVFLTAARSGDPPLFLEVALSGNCFRNPLPPS